MILFGTDTGSVKHILMDRQVQAWRRKDEKPARKLGGASDLPFMGDLQEQATPFHDLADVPVAYCGCIGGSWEAEFRGTELGRVRRSICRSCQLAYRKQGGNEI